MSEPVVKIENVSKVYAQGAVKVHALRGVSLTIEKGDFAVLAGPSGSGKTTLLNLIGALDEPSEGRISLDGVDLSHMRSGALASLRLHRIGFVFQAYNLIPVLTAYENAEYPLLLQGAPVARRRERVQRVLEAVGLRQLEDRRPAELSGGQQQRVAVARAIAAGPSLVLADEPTANLDSKTGAELVELMHGLKQDHEVTFIFSSHDPKVVDRAERLIRLQDGQLVSDERRPA